MFHLKPWIGGLVLGAFFLPALYFVWCWWPPTYRAPHPGELLAVAAICGIQFLFFCSLAVSDRLARACTRLGGEVAVTQAGCRVWIGAFGLLTGLGLWGHFER